LVHLGLTAFGRFGAAGAEPNAIINPLNTLAVGVDEKKRPALQ
jgi:hypothetical protein